jgi:putative transposase
MKQRTGNKSMMFSLIDARKTEMPVETACLVLEVSPCGYYAWRSRLASKRQRYAMVVLAHIREQFEFSREGDVRP